MHKFSHLVKPAFYIVILVTTMFLVLAVEKAKPSDFGFYKDIFNKEIVIKRSSTYPLNANKVPLTASDTAIAKIAWKYFEHNFNEKTGLCNSVDKYQSTTLWDVGSSLHALLSAKEIGLISYEEMKGRLLKCLSSMEQMPLYKDKLPNKVYHTATLKMVDYANNITPTGVGWSALDIGRFFSVCRRIFLNYPEFSIDVKKVISRWKVEFIIKDATLHGVGFNFKERKENIVQEGKLGYEEYAAKGYQALGFDVSEALQYTDFIKFVDVYYQQIAVDSREIKSSPAFNYVLSEPYILDGIEYGWDINSKELSYRVYKAQKERFEHTGVLTAVSETHIDTTPYFVYNTVYANGKTWTCVSESGDDAEEFKTFSTASAFGWYTLYKDYYSEILYNEFMKMSNKDLGWYSGKYEKSLKMNRAINTNTNGMILECLRYKNNGPLNKL